ncbi:MAG TPA: hypothetical protein PLQ32_10935 [Flavihumibacter sp.]|nr:hypothetical protein [Flavihumibacter sp.]
MKPRLVILLAVGAFFLSQQNAAAQIQKGNVLIGGNISNINLDLGTGKNFALSISPKAAWFIKDNLAVGGYVNFGLNTAKNAGTGINYGVGGLGRYYFGRETVDLLRHARFFMEANAGIEGYNPAVGDNTNGFGFGAGPGIAYFVTPNIGLEALVKYNGIVGFGSAPTSNNINIGFGFQIYLPSKKIREVGEEVKEQTRSIV